MATAWTAVYHSDVFNDLQYLGKINASKILKIIESKLIPDPSGVDVSEETAIPGCHFFKFDDFHIVYQLDANRAEFYILVIRQETGLSDDNNGQKAKTHHKVGQ